MMADRVPHSMLGGLAAARRRVVGEPAVSQAGAAINLLPIPAVILQMRGGGFVIEEMNDPFRAAGLAGTGDAAPMLSKLGPQLLAFMVSAVPADDLAWQHGELVDCRHYRVHVARSTRGVDRCLVTFVDRTAELRTEQNQSLPQASSAQATAPGTVATA